MEGVVPSPSLSSPLRGYEQQFHTVAFTTPEMMSPLSDGIGDGFSWGDDMYASSGDESASSVEQQPHAASQHLHLNPNPYQANKVHQPGSNAVGDGICRDDDGHAAAADDDDDDEDEESDGTAATWSSSSRRNRNGGPNIRRRSSIGRVAYRWGLTPADAAEIVNNFESVQSPDPLPGY